MAVDMAPYDQLEMQHSRAASDAIAVAPTPLAPTPHQSSRTSAGWQPVGGHESGEAPRPLLGALVDADAAPRCSSPGSELAFAALCGGGGAELEEEPTLDVAGAADGLELLFGAEVAPRAARQPLRAAAAAAFTRRLAAVQGPTEARAAVVVASCLAAAAGAPRRTSADKARLLAAALRRQGFDAEAVDSGSATPGASVACSRDASPACSPSFSGSGGLHAALAQHAARHVFVAVHRTGAHAARRSAAD
jgi:hypothetical protein